MRQITTILLLLISLACSGQENTSLEYLHIVGEVRSSPANPKNSRAVSFPCYAEVTIDTVPAIELSFGAWEQKGLVELLFEALGQEGFTVNPPEVRDTIGERVEEVIRIFFYTEDGEKKYLDLVQRNYVSGTKDRDRRFEAYNY